MTDFEMLYDEMSENYSEMESMLVDIYSQLQVDPTNSQLQASFQSLGNVAKGMLHSQIKLTDIYCQSDLKATLISNLESKYNDLQSVLEDTRGRSL